MLNLLAPLKKTARATQSALITSANWISDHTIDIAACGLTIAIGGPKLAQGIGQMIFSAGLDDEYLGFSAKTDEAIDYSLIIASSAVILCSRIPKMYLGFQHLLTKIFHRRGYANADARFSLTHQEITYNLSLSRKIIYYTSFGIFIASGAISVAFIGLNALQSGASLMKKLEGGDKYATDSLDRKGFIGAVYTALGSLVSWGFFNGPRLTKNARILAKRIATIGQNNGTISPLIAVAALLVLIYALGYAAYSIVSTEKALESFNGLFLHLPPDGKFKDIKRDISEPAAFPPLPTVMLTSGADLINILTGEFPLLPSSRTPANMILFSAIAVFGVVDAVLGNTAGFFGSLLKCMDFYHIGDSNNKWHRIIAGTIALLTTPVYWSNNGAQALGILQKPESANTTSTPFWRHKKGMSLGSATSIETYGDDDIETGYGANQPTTASNTNQNRTSTIILGRSDISYRFSQARY